MTEYIVDKVCETVLWIAWFWFWVRLVSIVATRL